MEEQEENKNLQGFKIIGLNLLIFVAYIILLFASPFTGLAFALYFLHFFLCIIVGAVKKNLYWILSGVIIILIGFSTCVILLNHKVF